MEGRSIPPWASLYDEIRLIFADLLLCEPMYQFKLITSTIYYNRSDNSHHRVYGICAIWDLLKYCKKITLDISKWRQNLIQPPIYPFYAHTIPWWAYWDEVNTTLNAWKIKIIKTSISRDMVSATKGRQSRTPNKWKPSKMGKKRQWPLWPWTWPYDLGVIGVCTPCLYPPTILIWWWSEIIKAVKCVFQGLTLKGQYLTLRAKNQNSAALIFCIWHLRTFLGVSSTLLSELWEEFAKTRKIGEKTAMTLVTLNLTLWPWGHRAM